ncbi:unnamed protein product [Discula destructiva]
MAIFVDLDDDDVDLPQHDHNVTKPVWNGTSPAPSKPSAVVAARDDGDSTAHNDSPSAANAAGTSRSEATHEPAVHESPNSMTVALGCYPIVSALASHLDLNDVDSLSRTCRAVHDSLLHSRSVLLRSTLHCSNENVPVDPESTLRYRARAGNWYYMEDTSRTAQYNGKSGSCARDMVAECRKCATIVCRNCAIKPPAPAVLRDRHRRLCFACQKSPIGCLANPTQSAELPLTSHTLQRAVCRCATDAGVWLCQPCGRGIRGADSEYRGIWKWRSQYGEVLGGLGTGIGDADRGVECARGKHCLSGKFIEHETDCDADDAREAEDLAAGHASPSTQTRSLYSGSHSWSSSHSSLHGSSAGSASGGLLDVAATPAATRTPSPAFGPGYSRHEVEGIGNKIKTVKVSMIRVGGCVPEWKDEKVMGQSLRREIAGEVRSWCGWCDRAIPGKPDHDAAERNCAAAPLRAA